MSTVDCPSCGTAHGPEQRYCLACGTLVGRRSVDIEQAVAFADEGRSPAGEPSPEPAPAPTPTRATTAAAAVDLWRRPTTSVLTAVALLTGLAAGFVLESQGDRAVGAPVAASGRAATAPATTPSPSPPAAEATQAPGAPTAAADPAADPAAPEAAADAGGAATPSSPDAAAASTPVATPVSAVATPQAADAATPSSAAPATTPTTSAPAEEEAASSSPAAKAKTKTPSAKADAPAAPTDDEPKRTSAAADAGLPKIDHVWVIGIGAPVTARDGGYLGETLLARGTELSNYAPGAADPLAGAAALVAGRTPSAKAQTIAGQLTATKRTWRAYAPGTPSCSDEPGVNPFLAFASVTTAADCADGVAGLAALPGDLRTADATPAFSYVATDPTLDPAGLDAQLRQIVEPIRGSAAYRRSGLIAIVPTSADPAAPSGALLLSRFAAGSTSIGTTLGPYSLLRTFDDLLGLERLGHAADADVRALGPDVLTPDD